jgi:branched-chain amino acid transport system permease protein
MTGGVLDSRRQQPPGKSWGVTNWVKALNRSGGSDRASLPGMVGLLIFAAALPGTGLLSEADIQVLFYVALYAVLALGLNIVVGYAGLLDLGYIAFFGIGAYLYAILASQQFGWHWPILVVMALGAATAGIFGMIFGGPTLRLRGDYLAIVTLGFGEIVQIISNNATGVTGGPSGIFSVDPAKVFGFTFTNTTQYYYLLLLIALIVIVASLRLGHSRIGRAWAAIREDEDAARASGINCRRMKLLAFCLAAAVAGLVGPVFAASQGYISPVAITLDQSVLVLSIVILGGAGSIRGAIVGAALLVIIPEVLREFATARFVVVGIAMVAIIILRPQGLVPAGAPRLFDLVRSLRRGTRGKVNHE